MSLCALAQRSWLGLLVFWFKDGAVPADLLAHGIEDAYSGNTKPTVSTVESPNPVLEDVRVAGRDGVGCCCERVGDVVGVQHFSPPEARHARNAIEILDAFAGVFQKSLIEISQLPILIRRPGKSRHVLDDQPSFAVAVMD